jgi:hypothetical protein
MKIEQLYTRLNEAAPEPLVSISYWPHHINPYSVSMEHAGMVSAETPEALETKLVEMSQAELLKHENEASRIRVALARKAQELEAK